MPKIKSSLPLPGDEAVVLERPYLISEVESFTSNVQGFVGLRVTLALEGKDVIAIPIWEREVASRKSKLGTFLEVLGDNTDDWKGKNIVFVSWTAKNRQIGVATPEKPKA